MWFDNGLVIYFLHLISVTENKTSHKYGHVSANDVMASESEPQTGQLSLVSLSEME